MRPKSLKSNIYQQLTSSTKYNSFLFSPVLDFTGKSHYYLEQHSPNYKKIKAITQDLLFNKRHSPDFNLLAEAVSLFYSDKDILERYLQSLSHLEQQLIARLTWEGALSYSEACKYLDEEEALLATPITANSVRLIDKYSHWQPYFTIDLNTDLVDEQLNSEEEEDYLDEDYYIELLNPAFYMPDFIRSAYSAILPPPKQALLAPTQISLGWEILDMEKDIFKEVTLMMDMLRNKDLIIEGAPKFTIAMNDLFPIQAKLSPITFARDKGYLKALMLASLLAPHLNAQDQTTLNLIKEAIKRPFSSDQDLGIILHQYIGEGLQPVASFDYHAHLLPVLHQLLFTLPSGSWYTVEDYIRYIDAKHFDLDLLKEDSINQLYSNIEDETASQYSHANYRIKQRLQRHNTIRSILQIAASFGLLKIAYTPWDSSQTIQFSIFNPTGKLMAFKMTPLGEHILLGKPNYLSPEVLDKEIRLADDSLTLQITDGDSSANPVLSKWMTRSAPSTWALDRIKLVKDCSSEADLVQNITQWLQHLNQPLPPYWKLAIVDLIHSILGLQELPEVIVLKLASSDTALHQHIVRDPVLSKLVYRAENKHVLIDPKNFERFRKRLQQLGYLVNPGSSTGRLHLQEDTRDLSEKQMLSYFKRHFKAFAGE